MYGLYGLVDLLFRSLDLHGDGAVPVVADPAGAAVKVRCFFCTVAEAYALDVAGENDVFADRHSDLSLSGSLFLFGRLFLSGGLLVSYFFVPLLLLITQEKALAVRRSASLKWFPSFHSRMQFTPRSLRRVCASRILVPTVAMT